MRQELIVLVDDAGKEIGTAPKLESHHDKTPLHRAFSCYIFDDKGRLLVTQRALSKKVWPGVWTNSVCGHPGPGESFENAIKRRSQDELGLDITTPEVVLPDYRYKTPLFNGIMENEICPVYIAFSKSDVHRNPDEVEDYKWLDWQAYALELNEQADVYSYWAKDQFPGLQKQTRIQEITA